MSVDIRNIRYERIVAGKIPAIILSVLVQRLPVSHDFLQKVLKVNKNYAKIKELCAKGGVTVRERILQIERGKIAEPRPDIICSASQLEDVLSPGDVWRTTITVRSRNRIPVRGMIHSINPFVSVTPTQMNSLMQPISIEVTVPKTYSDEELEGAIYLVTDGGEYTIPYHFTILEEEEMQGGIRFETIEQLTTAAKMDFEGMARLFASSAFLKMPFIRNDLSLQTVYRSALMGGNWRRALEEFLIYTGQKKSVNAVLESEIVSCRLGEENKIVLIKSGWGYFNVQVYVEKDGFVSVQLPKPTYQAGRCEILLHIDEKKLHGGRNGCLVTVTVGSQKMRVMVLVNMPSSAKKQTLQLKKSYELYENLLDCLIAADEGDSLCCESPFFEKLEAYLKNEDVEEYQDILLVWKLIEQKNVEQAAKVLEECKQEIEEKESSNFILYAFFRMEQAYVTYGAEKSQCMEWLRQTALEKMDARILYMYHKVSQTPIEIEEAEEWFEKGCRSPYLYHMVYKRWSTLELVCYFHSVDLKYQVMNFALSRETVSKEMLKEFFYELKYERSYRIFIFQMLCQIYRQNPSDQVLEKIVGLLIRNSKVSGKYFEWFELAVKHDLKMIGLYEAFLTALPKNYQEPFPYLLLVYYTYNSDLTGILKEKIYENLVNYFGADDKLLASYDTQMKEYIISRLLKRELSARLIYVYHSVLQAEIIDEELAKGVINLCYAWKISVDINGISRVVVRYPQIEQEWIYPMKDGSACIPIYDEDAILSFVDRFGVNYLNVPWKKEKVYLSDEIYQTCLELLPEHISQKMAAFHNLKENEISDEEMLNWAEKLLEDKQLRQDARNLIGYRLIEYCSKHPQEHRYDNLLLQVKVESLSEKTRMELVKSLAERNFWLEAYTLIQQIGYQKVEAALLIKIVDHMVEQNKQVVDQFLICVSYYLLSTEAENHRVVEYLTNFLESGNEILYPVFLRAKRQRLSYGNLLSRMMIQSLFSGNYDWLWEIYPIYIQQADAEVNVIRAANLVFCYYYIIGIRELPREVIDWMLKEQDDRAILLRLAWITYVAKENEVGEEIQKKAIQYMEKCWEQGILMAAFAKVINDSRMIPDNLEGKTIIEVHAGKGKAIFLEYAFSEESGERFRMPMKEVYPGIYTLALTVFSDEVLECHAVVESAVGIELSESLQMVISERVLGKEGSTFTRLEQTIAQTFSATEQEADGIMDQLIKKQVLTEKLFPYKK